MNRSSRLLAALTLALTAVAVPAPQAVSAATGDDFQTADDVLRYLTEHRRTAALTSHRIGSRSTVRHRADVPAPVASTAKIVHLAAYATAVARHRLSPAERVRVRDWEAYYLPGTDGGAHPGALKALGIPTDAHGRAADPRATVSLEQIVTAMIEHSDNAAPDYLRARLGERALLAAAADGGGPVPAAVPSFAGQMLLAFGACGVKEFGGAEGIRRLAALPARERRARAERCVRQYAAPGADRDRLTPQTLPALDVQAAWADTTEPIAPSTLAGLMGRIATGRFVSPKASALARRHLEWPTCQGPLNRRIVRMGTKGGSFPGILAEATYTVDRDGRVRVTVISLRRMPLPVWGRAVQTFAHQRFVVRLADTRGYPERVRGALS